MAAEIAIQPRVDAFLSALASMRPRRMAAEIHPAVRAAVEPRLRFNEAAANGRGNPKHCRMAARSSRSLQ